MTKVRILIVDDHPLFRAGLRQLIDDQTDLAVVAEAGDAREAIVQARETQPEVVTLDIGLPGTDGLAIIPELRRESPRSRILALTMHDDPAYIRTVLTAGGSGFVVKTAEPAELLSAIRAVHQGRFIVVTGSAEGLARVPGTDPASDRPKPPAEGVCPLSQREIEVLGLLVRGFTNREIAEHLFLSVKTVETYRLRLAEKLKLRTRAQMVEAAMKMGILGPHSS